MNNRIAIRFFYSTKGKEYVLKMSTLFNYGSGDGLPEVCVGSGWS